MTPFTALGFALAGGATGWSLTQGSGSGDAFQAGVYGKTGIGPAYLAGSLAFADTGCRPTELHSRQVS